MKTVTKKQRALCAKALRAYSQQLVERQAEFGDLVLQDFRDATEADDLAEQFEKEIKG